MNTRYTLLHLRVQREYLNRHGWICDPLHGQVFVYFGAGRRYSVCAAFRYPVGLGYGPNTGRVAGDWGFEVIETARGNPATWASLDTLVKTLLAHGVTAGDIQLRCLDDGPDRRRYYGRGAEHVQMTDGSIGVQLPVDLDCPF